MTTFTAQIHVINGGIFPSCPFNRLANACFSYSHSFLGGHIVTVIPLANQKILTEEKVHSSPHGWIWLAINIIPLVFANVLGVLLRTVSFLLSSNVRFAILRNPQVANPGNYTQELLKKEGIEFYRYFYENEKRLIIGEKFERVSLSPERWGYLKISLMWDIACGKQSELLNDPKFQTFVEDDAKAPSWYALENVLEKVKDLLSEMIECVKASTTSQGNNEVDEEHLNKALQTLQIIIFAGLLSIQKDLFTQDKNSLELEIVALYEQLKNLSTKENPLEIPTDEGLQRLLAMQKQPSLQTHTQTLLKKTGVEFFYYFHSYSVDLCKEGFNFSSLPKERQLFLKIQYLWDIALNNDRLKDMLFQEFTKTILQWKLPPLQKIQESLTKLPLQIQENVVIDDFYRLTLFEAGIIYAVKDSPIFSEDPLKQEIILLYKELGELLKQRLSNPEDFLLCFPSEEGLKLLLALGVIKDINPPLEEDLDDILDKGLEELGSDFNPEKFEHDIATDLFLIPSEENADDLLDSCLEEFRSNPAGTPPQHSASARPLPAARPSSSESLDID